MHLRVPGRLGSRPGTIEDPCTSQETLDGQPTASSSLDSIDPTLLDHPCFERAWCQQECALSRSTRFCCGSIHLEGYVFASSLEGFASYVATTGANGSLGQSQQTKIVLKGSEFFGLRSYILKENYSLLGASTMMQIMARKKAKDRRDIIFASLSL